MKSIAEQFLEDLVEKKREQWLRFRLKNQGSQSVTLDHKAFGRQDFSYTKEIPGDVELGDLIWAKISFIDGELESIIGDIASEMTYKRLKAKGKL